MTLLSADIATQMVRGWVRLYTKGLPADIAVSRREELDSDLWEQSNFAYGSMIETRNLTLHILGRWIFGIGDDLVWRQEQIKARKKESVGNLSERNPIMNFASMIVRPRTYINLVAVLAVMFLLFPIGIGAFVAAVVSVVVPLAFIAAPFIYKWENIEIGPFIVDTLPEALITSLIGLVLLAIVIIITNTIVSVLGRFVSIHVGKFHFGRRQ